MRPIDRAARPSAPRRAAWRLLVPLLCGWLVVACADDPQSQLDEARALQDGGDFAASLPILDQVLEKEPENVEANYRRGLALISTGEPNRAIWYLRRVPVEGEFGSEAALLLAQHNLRAKNYEEAIAAADRVLAAHPDQLQALVLRAQVRHQRSELASALEDLDRALRIDPDSLEPLAMRAAVLQQLGRNADALGAYEVLEKKASGTENARAGGACLARTALAAKGGADALIAGVKECDERYALNAQEAELAIYFLEREKRGADATRLLKEWVGKRGDNHRLRGLLVMRLLRLGLRDEAAAEIAPLAQASSTASDWMTVATLQRQAGSTEDALASYQKAAELDPKLLTAQHVVCDLLVELGRLEEAETRAAQLPEATLRDFVLGRVALVRGDPARALELLNGALLQWPSNQGGRLLAARAALQLGRLDEGTAHLREATRASEGKGEPALLLAQLYYARGDYVQASHILESYVMLRTPDPAKVIERTPQGDVAPEPAPNILPEARVLIAKLGVASGQYGAAREALEPLREETPARFAVEAARITRVESGPAAALAELEDRELDWAHPRSDVALRERVELAVASGQPKRAAAFLERLAAQNAGAAHVHVARALLGLATGDLAAAEASLARAAALAPDDPRVLAAQGTLARMRGDLAGSRSLLERAIAAAPREATYQYERVHTLMEAGDKDEAEAGLRELVILQPDFAPAANDLAWLLAEKGSDLPLAEDLARRAVRILPLPEVRDTLGYVQLKRGAFGLAVHTLEAVRKDRPDYATARYHLALALAQSGKSAEAREELRAALAGAPFPEADAAKLELARLEQGEMR